MAKRGLLNRVQQSFDLGADAEESALPATPREQMERIQEATGSAPERLTLVSTQLLPSDLLPMARLIADLQLAGLKVTKQDAWTVMLRDFHAPERLAELEVALRTLAAVRRRAAIQARRQKASSTLMRK